MSEQEIDQKLVERVQRGDQRAFDVLVKKYQHKIMSLVSRYVKQPGDVADVAQETFIKAYRALPNFRGESAFYTWLYRIAVNTSKNYLVSRSRKPVGSDVDIEDVEFMEQGQALKEIATPESLMMSDQLKQTVMKAIDDLPDDLKQAITLRELDGLGYEEIAQTMDCPIGTVRSRIFRAREAIDERIRPLLDQE
ncbi:MULTISPECIES: RNA polymerase sigma factor RpoE [Gammaproteobacteria]|uniref:RNA polymerase sigma factor RpoE n=1 Tax=Gammaproteobacteria TaxID=1236 RepID=UPI000DD04ABD|nr:MULTISPECIES: RNA polymerase sigma factor RpoE [Gammaproteobacteria]RTE87103.1 RNA polymerase sigma factor RpoE [Aliidiomarina sp. B3213]TCZ93109.1 RNA polymerase sigma factor RpoE [Lysobacter sp. N42]